MNSVRKRKNEKENKEKKDTKTTKMPIVINTIIEILSHKGIS